MTTRALQKSLLQTATAKISAAIDLIDADEQPDQAAGPWQKGTPPIPDVYMVWFATFAFDEAAGPELAKWDGQEWTSESGHELETPSYWAVINNPAGELWNRPE